MHQCAWLYLLTRSKMITKGWVVAKQNKSMQLLSMVNEYKIDNENE